MSGERQPAPGAPADRCRYCGVSEDDELLREIVNRDGTYWLVCDHCLDKAS